MIRLGWPPKELNPNHAGKLRAKMRAIKAYRTEAMVATMAALPGARVKPETEVPMVVTFYPPDSRRRDRDNIIASFKRGQDGIALALRADDHWFRVRYQFGEPVNGGAVVVTIGEPNRVNGHDPVEGVERVRNRVEEIEFSADTIVDA